MKVGLNGLFKLVVYDGSSDTIKFESRWYNNIITDRGLLNIQIGWSIQYIEVGSGPPNVSYFRTDLVNKIAQSKLFDSAPIASGLRLEDGHAYARYKFNFNIGAVQGVVSEIGIRGRRAVYDPSTGLYPSVYELLTYAALSDINGVPAPVTLGGVDRLSIVYEFRQYWPTEDLEFVAPIVGIDRQCMARVADYERWKPQPNSAAGVLDNGTWSSYDAQICYGDGTIGPHGGSPTGTIVRSTGLVNGNRGWGYRTTKIIFGVSRGYTPNLNVVKVLPGSGSNYSPYAYHVGGAWQISFDPPVTKSALENFSLDVTLYWNRHPAN